MKKLIAVVVLASIPIGISASLYIAGGLGELLLFWAMIAGCVAAMLRPSGSGLLLGKAQEFVGCLPQKP